MRKTAGQEILELLHTVRYIQMHKGCFRAACIAPQGDGLDTRKMMMVAPPGAECPLPPRSPNCANSAGSKPSPISMPDRIYNFRYLQRALEMEMERTALQASNQLIMADLDHFQEHQRRYGHGKGMRPRLVSRIWREA